ncbi:hypothetical protein F4680DRAFT_399753 [Xylaria scruposa]|nr:hypothetical protein F4680DRAFT_399753 [Xylaria scruposa]
MGQYAYVRRPVFSPSLAADLSSSPHYEMTNVPVLFNNATRYQPTEVKSPTIDVFAIERATRKVRRLMGHQQCCNPVNISANDHGHRWQHRHRSMSRS